MKKKLATSMAIFFTGVCMGIADLIPGVSGGTIAFISGFYERLLNAISGITDSLKQLLRGNITGLFAKSDIIFLLTLFSGVLCSILLFSHVIAFLLENHLTQIRSFFVGVILCSCVIIAKKAQLSKQYMAMIGGIMAGIMLSLLGGISIPHSQLGFFVGGVVASMAMILPGISGSYILFLLGLYEKIISYLTLLSPSDLLSMEVLSNNGVQHIAALAAGAVLGLLIFCKLLSWLLQKYHDTLISTLVGFMIGTLPLIFPENMVTLHDYSSAIGRTILGAIILFLLEYSFTNKKSLAK